MHTQAAWVLKMSLLLLLQHMNTLAAEHAAMQVNAPDSDLACTSQPPGSTRGPAAPRGASGFPCRRCRA